MEITFFVYIIIGFAAQMIDGTMGMAYGVSCRTFLSVAGGVPSAIASAVVHCAEIPMTLVSGISHWKLKNFDKGLFLRLIVPGMVGGVIGAWFIFNIGDKIEPFINGYLIIMGGVIISKALTKREKAHREVGGYIYPLGFFGGFFDATGGGGWGPVVTSTMLASDHDPKKTIGSVNAAEFFVTAAETTTFIVLIADFSKYGGIILGLIIGGVCAAPLAALLCKKAPVKPLLFVVGTLIILLNSYSLIHWFL